MDEKLKEKLVHFNSIRERLIELARSHEIITYGELEGECNIPNPTPGPKGENLYYYNLLYDLGSFEALFERPPINALVVTRSEGKPGQGLYNWAKLRLKQFDISNPYQLLEQYRSECKEYWSDAENYRLYSRSIAIEYCVV
jgi:hypothetical protein